MSGRSARRDTFLAGAVLAGLLLLALAARGRTSPDPALVARLRAAPSAKDRVAVANELLVRHGARGEQAVTAYALADPLLEYEPERRLLVWYEPDDASLGHTRCSPSDRGLAGLVEGLLGCPLPEASSAGLAFPADPPADVVALHTFEEPSGAALFVLEQATGDAFPALRVAGDTTTWVQVTRDALQRRQADVSARRGG